MNSKRRFKSPRPIPTRSFVLIERWNEIGSIELTEGEVREAVEITRCDEDSITIIPVSLSVAAGFRGPHVIRAPKLTKFAEKGQVGQICLN
jgi:hypothetical protein